MLASGSFLITDVVDQLHEDSRKIHRVERLTRHLNRGILNVALSSYLHPIRKWVPDKPVIHIDDSDIVKPDGYKFESLGLVRDGPKSTNTKNAYEKGYYVTEASVVTKSNHPVSIYSKIHFSKEKTFTSVNTVNFGAIERGKAMFGKASFVMDRGYHDIKMFPKIDELKQDYVILLTAKRNLLFHSKWVASTELRNRRKGKIMTPYFL